MEQQIEEAAYNYSQCQHPISFEEQKMHAKGFMAGANWQKNRTKWIPIEEEQPKMYQKCLFKNPSIELRIKIGDYLGGEYPPSKNEFFLGGARYTASHWCPIPESLLEDNETELNRRDLASNLSKDRGSENTNLQLDSKIVRIDYGHCKP